LAKYCLVSMVEEHNRPNLRAIKTCTFIASNEAADYRNRKFIRTISGLRAEEREGSMAVNWGIRIRMLFPERES